MFIFVNICISYIEVYYITNELLGGPINQFIYIFNIKLVTMNCLVLLYRNKQYIY